MANSIDGRRLGTPLSAPSQRRFAIAGPSGSGKSTLAQSLVTLGQGIVCVQEPEPPPEICLADHVAPPSAYRFQEAITYARQSQALSAKANLLIFDRTFEEDREVFLRLYQELGSLTRTQVQSLCRLSEECETSVGDMHGGVILTATLDVLRRRVLSDRQERPAWLQENLALQRELYINWAETAALRFLVLDTSGLSESAVSKIARPLVRSLLKTE